MDSSKKWQVRVFDVDGLNLDEKPFVVNNEIMFSSMRAGENRIKNVVNAHVLLKRPISKKNHDIESRVTNELKDIGEALEKLSIFLACYNLASNKDMPKIHAKGSRGTEINENDELVKFATSGYADLSIVKSYVKQYETSEVRSSLEKTVSLYNQVNQILDSKSNKLTKRSLKTSLILYQRGAASEIYEAAILEFISAIEALFTNVEDLRYKFALRTSLALETSPEVRKDLFNFLNETYGIRNNLIHGVDIELGQLDTLITNVRMMKIVGLSLLKFINFISSDKTKKDLMDRLDNIALGTEKSF